ncbi:MAG TPA: hypothetical protein VMQ10_03210 [Spirochaetia bacterium]|nr:hypothetical protein [Spirochaetia bacterium]
MKGVAHDRKQQLRGLTDRGVTLMVSTHDLDVAAREFRRIMLLTCCDGGDAHHAHGPGAHAEGDRAEIPASAGTESRSDR